MMRIFFFNSNGNEHYTWRTHFTQPLPTKTYSKFTPQLITLYSNLYLYPNVRIYSEDRGSSYSFITVEFLAKGLLGNLNAIQK